tara:strand:- start:241 stop:624 length:384 start_codon:yes stop_codon:yes gene_type:complete
MASELRVNTLKDSAGNNSIGMSFVAGGTLKAWCSWSMNDTGSPYDSFSISSITDDSTTQNTMTYSSAFNTSNGQCVTTATNANSAGVTNYSSSDLQIHTPTTTSVKIQSQSNANPAFNGMQTSGDLA